MRTKEIFSFGFLSLLKRFNYRERHYYQTTAVLRNGLFRCTWAILAILLLPPMLYSCEHSGISGLGGDLFSSPPPEPLFTCSVTTFMDKDFHGYLSERADNGLSTRVGIMSFNVPKNFSPIAVPANDGYGTVIAAKFREQLLKYSPYGIFEFFSAEHITFEDGKRDFERNNDKLINFATYKGYNTLVLGQLNSIINSSELNFSVKIIDLSSQVTVWSGEAVVTATTRNKNVNEANQSLFYFNERASKAAECATKAALRK